VCPIDDCEQITAGGEAGFLERYMQESVDFWPHIKWFTCLIGKRHTFEYGQTYLRTMVDRGSLGVIIATGTIELGKTKRWILGWRFNLIQYQP
jgi:23S rRNA A1618 N6-methylase RlmF